jgi:ATP-binding cassette subfamily F protein 3
LSGPLIKLLAGILPIQRGQRELGHNVQVGYFSQQRAEVFDLSRSVLEEACAQAQAPEQTARTLLGAFLFRGDDVFKPVGVLSGGEKTRLALARMLLNPPNLLLMDEPTTHLDMASIDALIAALQQFEGTLLFIGHDLYFIRAVATSVLHLRAGTVTLYPGDYDYYVEKTAVTAEHGITAGAAPESEVKRRNNSAGFKSRERKRLEAEERNAQARWRREIEARFHTVESEILLREQRQTELLNELETLGTSAASHRAKEIHLELARLAPSSSPLPIACYPRRKRIVQRSPAGRRQPHFAVIQKAAFQCRDHFGLGQLLADVDQLLPPVAKGALPFLHDCTDGLIIVRPSGPRCRCPPITDRAILS